jgi:hypothetical protein
LFLCRIKRKLIDHAGVRISRLEEALNILKQFFLEESVTFAGEYYTITDLKAIPKRCNTLTLQSFSVEAAKGS